MIRGALVFAAGLAIGYGKAMSETEAINHTVNQVIEKVKKAWDEAPSTAGENATDLTQEGIDFLMKRLGDALSKIEHYGDEFVVLRGGDDNKVLLTVRDLRAPFSTPDTSEGEKAVD